MTIPIRFGRMPDVNWSEEDGLNGSASDAVKLEYALRCLQVKNRHIVDLELQLKTLQLDLDAERGRFNRIEQTLAEFIEWRKSQRLRFETEPSTHSSKNSKTLGQFQFSKRQLWGALISFFVVVVGLLLWSLKPWVEN